MNLDKSANLDFIIKVLVKVIEVLTIVTVTLFFVKMPEETLSVFILILILFVVYLLVIFYGKGGSIKNKLEGVKKIDLGAFSGIEMNELLLKNNISESGDSKNGRIFSGVSGIYTLSDIVPYCESGSTIYYLRRGECISNKDPGFLYHLMVIDKNNKVITLETISKRQKKLKEIRELEKLRKSELSEVRSKLGLG